MTTPREKRNEKLAHKLIANLERRHFEAYYCNTSAEAVELVTRLVPEGSTVTWGGSASIRDTGITDALKRGPYTVYDRDGITDVHEKEAVYRKAFGCDYYLSSVNAMSEDGVMVNIDGNGNRVAAITWGPRRVILVVGLNKVCQDVPSALARARSTAAPVNAARFDINTPCQADGICHNCHSPESICNYIHFLRNSHPAKRHIVILVGEDLGY
ncbi:MAG: lactate utilization protein [Prevotella sp.]|nr:lactate utilization protein [Prevotella sp.]MDY5547195.1 lactate utilization protein [Prevotella sp.]